MEEYPVRNLKKGDILIVEMFVFRRAIYDECEGTASPAVQDHALHQREWYRWNVDFRLDSISVLYSVPPDDIDLTSDDDDSLDA